MLSRRPVDPVLGLDLFGVVEPPYLLAVPIALHQCDRFLMRLAAAGAGDDISAGQDSGGCTDKAGESGPLLHHAAVHVDDDDAIGFGRQEHGVSVPGLVGVIDRGARRVHRRRAGENRNQTGESDRACEHQSEDSTDFNSRIHIGLHCSGLIAWSPETARRVRAAIWDMVCQVDAPHM
jgi:hypothetical protein